MNAFLYLVWSTWRNRFVRGVRRIRSPRYAAALVVGLLYLYGFLVRPLNSGPLGPGVFGQPTEMIVTVLTVVTLMGSWVFGSDLTALAFTPAELSILFPAPLSRRALLGYKLFRAQIAVLLNALIWVFILRRGGSALHPLLRAISLWLLFSALNLHRLAAALVRSSWREHGAAGVRRHRWSIVAFALVGALVVVSFVRHSGTLITNAGPARFFFSLGQILASAPSSWALFPFHLIVAPTFAHTAAEWRSAIVPALVVLAVHLWWVLRADVAFEDAAITASAERAKRLEAMRSRRTLGAAAPPRRATSTIALASEGRPALAIFWKNLLCLRRTAQLRVFIGPVVMAVLLGGAMSGDGSDAFSIVAASALVLSAMLLVFGGRLIRNDLRQDMQHLPMLKSLPVAPDELMLAEVASSALPMAALQLALLVIAYVFAALTNFGLVSHPIRLGSLIAAPVAVAVLNVALMTIQNGVTVLFPSWVRLGPAVTTGVEALGQNVLGTTANLLSLAIGLVLPTLSAFVIVTALGGVHASSLALALLSASIILAIETYGALRLLGRALAKAEPYS